MGIAVSPECGCPRDRNGSYDVREATSIYVSCDAVFSDKRSNGIRFKAAKDINGGSVRTLLLRHRQSRRFADALTAPVTATGGRTPWPLRRAAARWSAAVEKPVWRGLPVGEPWLAVSRLLRPRGAGGRRVLPPVDGWYACASVHGAAPPGPGTDVAVGLPQ